MVDLGALLETISGYLRGEWDTQGLQVRLRLLEAPAWVLGSAIQLEQVFLNLLARAQEASAASAEKLLSLAMSATGRRVQVEITFSHDPRKRPEDDNLDAASPDDPTRLGFGVIRGIMQGHGGEIRLVRAFANSVRYEVEMALHQAPVGPASSQPRPEGLARPLLTVLVMEPDEAVRREIIQNLSARRHRAVPVSHVEEALDLVFRVRFDGAFGSLRMSGSHWAEFYDRVKSRLAFFVLLTEAYDEAVTWSSSGCEGYVLHKPVKPEEMEKLLETVENRLAGGEQPGIRTG